MSARPLTQHSEASFDTSIKPLRERVDAIDAELLRLLNSRAEVVNEIYALKIRHGVNRFDRARTGAILDRLAALSAGPLSPEDVRELFTPLLKYFVERYTPPKED